MIKEYCEQVKHAVIRDQNYGSQMSKFINFYNEALLDFPNLKPEDVRIVKYGGKRFAKTFGIEFFAAEAPDSYLRISNLEHES